MDWNNRAMLEVMAELCDLAQSVQSSDQNEYGNARRLADRVMDVFARRWAAWAARYAIQLEQLVEVLEWNNGKNEAGEPICASCKRSRAIGHAEACEIGRAVARIVR